jgi:hypothetical protein
MVDVLRQQPIGGYGRDIVGPFKKVFSLPFAGSLLKSRDSRGKSQSRVTGDKSQREKSPRARIPDGRIEVSS